MLVRACACLCVRSCVWCSRRRRAAAGGKLGRGHLARGELRRGKLGRGQLGTGKLTRQKPPIAVAVAALIGLAGSPVPPSVRSLDALGDCGSNSGHGTTFCAEKWGLADKFNVENKNVSALGVRSSNKGFTGAPSGALGPKLRASAPEARFGSPRPKAALSESRSVACLPARTRLGV